MGTGDGCHAWRRFELARWSVLAVRIAIPLVTAFLVLGLILPFLDDHGGTISEALAFEAGLGFSILMWAIIVANTVLWGTILLAILPIALRPSNAAVEVSKVGLRNHGGATLRWADVAGVTPRRLRQRVDVFDQSRSQVVQIEYQIEDFDEVVDTLVKRVPRPKGAARSFDFSPLPFQIQCFAGTALLVGFPLFAGQVWVALLMLGIIAVAYWLDTKDRVTSLAICSDNLSVGFAHRLVELRRDEVREAKLNLTVVQNGWKAFKIRLSVGSDVLDLDVPARAIFGIYLALITAWDLELPDVAEP